MSGGLKLVQIASRTVEYIMAYEQKIDSSVVTRCIESVQHCYMDGAMLLQRISGLSQRRFFAAVVSHKGSFFLI